MLVDILLAAVVALLALPALVLGARGLLRRTGRASIDERTDRAELVLLVLGRLIALLLLSALSAITLLACIGGLVKGLRVPSLVYVFFLADLLVATLVVLTFGRRGQRPARRSTSPAPR